MSSEEESDDMQTIIGVALSVLFDYGCADETRIARLARWIVFSLDADVQERQSGNMSTVVIDDPELAVWRYGDMIALRAGQGFPRSLTQDQARQLATALLMCVERAEAL